MSSVKVGRGDITELGRRAAKAREQEMAEAKRRAEPARHRYEERDMLTCLLTRSGSMADGNAVFTLETLNQLPHGIPALTASAPSLQRAEHRLRWAYAGALMDRRRRIYVGADASEKARARAKNAELYIAENPREGQT